MAQRKYQRPHALRAGLFFAALNLCTVAACESPTTYTDDGFVGGLEPLRAWLGFSTTEAISYDAIRTRVLAKYPVGTNISLVQQELPIALAVDGDINRDHVLHVTDWGSPSNCELPGNVKITFELDDAGRITDVTVDEDRVCA